MTTAAPTVVLESTRISATLDEFERIGNRYAGSDGEVQCREFLLEMFRCIGLASVRVEPLDYLAYAPGPETACALLAPEAIELPCRPLQYSATTTAEGEAVYLGSGSAADFERCDRLGVDLAGKVVLASTPYPFLLADVLEERRIGGFVLIGQTPDGLIGNFVATLTPGNVTSFPGVTIELGAAQALTSVLSLGRPVTMRLRHDAVYGRATTYNVVGEIAGSTRERIVVGAHYDSQAEGPCIFDNATGVASLVELARAFADTQPARTITVAAFAAEEVGTVGSHAFVERHAHEMTSVVSMVNLDAPASAFPAKREIWANATMRDVAVDTALAAEWTPEVVADLPATSDHAPFDAAEIPACLIWRPTHPYYHSLGDVRALVDAASVTETAQVSARLVARLAFEHEKPLPLGLRR